MSEEKNETNGTIRLPKNWIPVAAALFLGGGGMGVSSFMSAPRGVLEEIRADVRELKQHAIEPGHALTISRLERVESDVDQIAEAIAETNRRASTDVRKIEKTLAAICAALPRARCPHD